jgi:hypothetical protein
MKREPELEETLRHAADKDTDEGKAGRGRSRLVAGKLTAGRWGGAR